MSEIAPSTGSTVNGPVGNTVAVKMPGQTALVANLVSQIIAEVTSLPRGVVNIFTESGNTGAPYLVASVTT